MSGYLQRLLDRAPPRAAPAPVAAASRPASVLPAGPSLSPVALADQRLNDPSMLDQLGLPPVVDSSFGENAEEPSNAPAPALSPLHTGPGSHAGEPARTTPPQAAEPAPVRAELRPESSPEPAPEPAPRPSRRAPSEIDAFDLLPPETESPPAHAQAVAEPTPPAEVAAPPVNPAKAEIAKRLEVQALSAEPAPAQALPAQESRTPRIEVEPPRPQPMPAPDAEAQPRAAAAQIEPAARSVDVEPPPQRPPAPLPPALETRIAEPETTQVLKPDKPRKGEAEPVQREPEKTAPTRSAPRTAAAASIIGALPARPRALTLFGLRRR
jgi:hypothetical protein